ncbi:MAG TPA: dehydratase, partial [Nocardioidaceae bacterium]|nr:dehydratase [Nocardioidaceae bacterium]
VVDWCGDPGRIVEYGVRFTKPVVVPDPEGTAVDVVATVGALDPDAGTARIDLAATCQGVGVLGKARAVVRLG